MTPDSDESPAALAAERSPDIVATARMVTRLAGLLAWTFSLLILQVCVPVLRLVSQSLELRGRRWVMQTWAAGCLWITNVHVRVEGTPPAHPFYMVANHLSYLDIVPFARHLGCSFVAMHDMAEWPLVGFIARRTNTIFINRKVWREVRRVNEMLAAAMAEGQSILVFPESTTSYGNDLLPFRPALLEAPLAAGVPVHFAALQYNRTPVCPDPEHDVCWVDEVPFFTHGLRLLRLPRIDATLVFGAAPLIAPDRKSLAAALENAVREHLPTRAPSGALP